MVVVAYSLVLLAVTPNWLLFILQYVDKFLLVVLSRRNKLAEYV